MLLYKEEEFVRSFYYRVPAKRRKTENGHGEKKELKLAPLFPLPLPGKYRKRPEKKKLKLAPLRSCVGMLHRDG